MKYYHLLNFQCANKEKFAWRALERGKNVILASLKT